jgi:hypothetical protein
MFGFLAARHWRLRRISEGEQRPPRQKRKPYQRFKEVAYSQSLDLTNLNKAMRLAVGVVATTTQVRFLVMKFGKWCG